MKRVGRFTFLMMYVLASATAANSLAIAGDSPSGSEQPAPAPESPLTPEEAAKCTENALAAIPLTKSPRGWVQPIKRDLPLLVDHKRILHTAPRVLFDGHIRSPLNPKRWVGKKFVEPIFWSKEPIGPRVKLRDHIKNVADILNAFFREEASVLNEEVARALGPQDLWKTRRATRAYFRYTFGKYLAAVRQTLIKHFGETEMPAGILDIYDAPFKTEPETGLQEALAEREKIARLVRRTDAALYYLMEWERVSGGAQGELPKLEGNSVPVFFGETVRDFWKEVFRPKELKETHPARIVAEAISDPNKALSAIRLVREYLSEWEKVALSEFGSDPKATVSNAGDRPLVAKYEVLQKNKDWQANWVAGLRVVRHYLGLAENRAGEPYLDTIANAQKIGYMQPDKWKYLETLRINHWSPLPKGSNAAQFNLRAIGEFFRIAKHATEIAEKTARFQIEREKTEGIPELAGPSQTREENRKILIDDPSHAKNHFADMRNGLVMLRKFMEEVFGEDPEISQRYLAHLRATSTRDPAAYLGTLDAVEFYIGETPRTINGSVENFYRLRAALRAAKRIAYMEPDKNNYLKVLSPEFRKSPEKPRDEAADSHLITEFLDDLVMAFQFAQEEANVRTTTNPMLTRSDTPENVPDRAGIERPRAEPDQVVAPPKAIEPPTEKRHVWTSMPQALSAMITEPTIPETAPTLDGGPIRLGRVLGAGGLGIVRLAQRPNKGKDLAIKILRENRPDDIDRLKASKVVADTVGAKTYRHVAKVWRVVPRTKLTGQNAYSVSEYAGPDLQTLVHHTGPLSPANAVDFLFKMNEGMMDVHETDQEIGDLKEGNIAISSNSDVKFLDLGAPKLTQRERAELLATSLRSGTQRAHRTAQRVPNYKIDPGWELYPASFVLYLAVVGHPPEPSLRGVPLPSEAMASSTDPKVKRRYQEWKELGALDDINQIYLRLSADPTESNERDAPGASDKKSLKRYSNDKEFRAALDELFQKIKGQADLGLLVREAMPAIRQAQENASAPATAITPTRTVEKPRKRKKERARKEQHKHRGKMAEGTNPPPAPLASTPSTESASPTDKPTGEPTPDVQEDPSGDAPRNFEPF